MFVRSAHLIEGVTLFEPVSAGGLTVVPVERGYVGRDLREIFQEHVTASGFVSTFTPPMWGTQLGVHHRLSFATSTPARVTGADALALHADAERLLDALVLVHGGAPRLVVTAVESSDDGLSWRQLAVVGGGGAWPHSALERLRPDGVTLDGVEVGEAWARTGQDRRLAFWLSLYRDLRPERRWDVSIFRCWSLVETISAGVDVSGGLLRDERGVPLRTWRDRPAEGRSKEGRVYQLVRLALGAINAPADLVRTHPAVPLWEEVQVWYLIRNAVAHEGMWGAAARDRSGEEKLAYVSCAFQRAARGGGIDEGWGRYSNAVLAATEAVLRAAVLGRLGP